MATGVEPSPGDWVIQLVEDNPGFAVYEINNGVGRVVGLGPTEAKVSELNPEGRPVFLLDRDGEYRRWES